MIGARMADATTGALVWTATSNTFSWPGRYAIEGSGLTAAKYVFTQAAGNVTAVTSTAATPPAPVLNTTTQLQADLVPQSGSAPQTLSPSPTLTLIAAPEEATPTVTTAT